jgi:protein TonB
MSRKYITLLLLITGLNVFSQKKADENVYFLWTKDWKATSDMKESAYFARLGKNNSGLWKLDLYNIFGPMISCEHYKDRETKQQEGLQTFYHPTGFIDSTGSIENNALQGDWQYYNDTGRLIFKKKYDKGKLVYLKDVINDPDTSIKINDIKEDGHEKESDFPGGVRAWQRFMIKNMQYPERAFNAKVMGEVIIIFVVDTEGRVDDPKIFRSVEYSIDEAALELIKKSPKWNPATQYGKLVRSYKKQPVIYRLE